MSFSSRIFGMIEMELSKQLSFTLTLKETDHALGADPRRVRIGDTIRFTVTGRNDAEFRLRSIRGGITPCKYVQFRPTNFVITEMPGGSTALVATIDALVLAIPERGNLMDQVATISLSAGADLSNLVFQEWEKPVNYATRSDQRSPDRGIVMGNSRTRSGSIPLSGIPLSELV
jgi:hypothetical protein